MNTTKRCTKCGADKPFDQFNKDKSRRDGHRDRCKACIKAYQADWRPGYVAELQQQATQVDALSTKACTSCGIEKPLTAFHRTPASADGRRPICDVCACAYQHAHRFDPRYADKVKEHDYLKYHTMPQEEKKRSNHRIHLLHQKRYWDNTEYQERERKRANHKCNHRRLKKAGNGGSHTSQEWADLCAQYGHRCLCCGLVRPLTRDHIIPVDLGGIDDISNIQPLCRPCNSTKGNRTIDYRPIN